MDVPDITIAGLRRVVQLLAEHGDGELLQIGYAIDVWVNQSADVPIDFAAALGWRSGWASMRRAERDRRLLAVRERWFPRPLSDRQAAADILAAVHRYHRDHGPPTAPRPTSPACSRSAAFLASTGCGRCSPTRRRYSRAG